uniref:Transmembrane 4 L six family member 19 n=1 Tax=Aotus nancymaae TaxID=37293 RepID=A0A2K5D5V3_AOTNA
MLSSLCTLACSRTCSQILGLSLGTAALFAAGANMALLFPNWDVTYLLRGLVGRHAMLGTGLWGGGLMVLTAATLISLTGWRYGCLRKSGLCRSVKSPGGLARAALLGSLPRLSGSGVGGAGGFACLRSSQVMGQLGQGPHFGDHCPRNYLYDRLLWSSVCLEPSKAVVWHVAFFSALLCISLLQLLLVVVHVINSFLGLFCSLCEK